MRTPFRVLLVLAAALALPLFAQQGGPAEMSFTATRAK